MAVGDKIAELRNRRGLSQYQLAKMLNVATSTLGMYETNKRKPNVEMLEQIAEFFNVSTDYLLGRKAPDNNDIDLDRAIDNAMSFDGKPVTDHDRKIMKQLWKAYMAGKE